MDGLVLLVNSEVPNQLEKQDLDERQSQTVIVGAKSELARLTIPTCTAAVNGKRLPHLNSLAPNNTTTIYGISGASSKIMSGEEEDHVTLSKRTSLPCKGQGHRILYIATDQTLTIPLPRKLRLPDF
jgi:hypothetical protein